MTIHGRQREYAGRRKPRTSGEIQTRMNIQSRNLWRTVIALGHAALLLQSCNVGPKYNRPSVQSPATFKEVTPEDLKKMDGWKMAEPKDTALHGKWWEIFGDPELNALEEQVSVSNQNVAAAFANFMAARAIVRQARSQYYPTVTVGPSIVREHQPSTSVNSTASSSGRTFASFVLPFDATWTPDLWGRVRNTVKANVYNAQVSAADLENTKLTAQAELAVDYYEMRGQDSLKELLDSTVVVFQQSLDLTKVLYETGIDSDEAVAQAETQLNTTRVQATNVGIARAQFEHAIALLVGQPASTFSIPVAPLKVPPPAIPFGVPSQLLERRPDIAAAERQMAQANAQIGVAKAAYYPTVTLSAAGGFESTSISQWFTWPSRFWSVGPTASETLFDAGLRRATVEQFRAQYDASVANYRQDVLVAFQQVEDNLAALRILSEEIQQQGEAVKSAQRVVTVATDRYRLGIDPYLNVIVAQASFLSNQQTDVSLRVQQITASVQLMEALGGGWDASVLPAPQQIISRDSSVMSPSPSPTTAPSPSPK
jgi:NodT family efflux transporter outer membrane factor (OMF) lipoprotein